MSLILPSWFKQRQAKAEPAGDNVYRLTAPQLREAFIAIRQGADGRWEFTEPDWAEMRRVVAGDGPVSRSRRALIERRYRQNRWLRLALSDVAAQVA